jgi:hypothetical protein
MEVGQDPCQRRDSRCDPAVQLADPEARRPAVDHAARPVVIAAEREQRGRRARLADQRGDLALLQAVLHRDDPAVGGQARDERCQRLLGVERLDRQDERLDRPRHGLGLACRDPRDELGVPRDLQPAGLDGRDVGALAVHQPHGVPGPPEVRADQSTDRACPDDGQLHGLDHRTRAAARLPVPEAVVYRQRDR